jgi:hypothetical protein
MKIEKEKGDIEARARPRFSNLPALLLGQQA